MVLIELEAERAEKTEMVGEKAVGAEGVEVGFVFDFVEDEYVFSSTSNAF